jgi:hypothetical protein
MARPGHHGVGIAFKKLIERERSGSRQSGSEQDPQESSIVWDFLGADVKTYECRYQNHENDSRFRELRKIGDPAEHASRSYIHRAGSQTHPENCSVKTG